jgi:hypothetical protein
MLMLDKDTLRESVIVDSQPVAFIAGLQLGKAYRCGRDRVGVWFIAYSDAGALAIVKQGT